MLCSSDEQVEAVRTEMQATVSRLENEIIELQQSRTTLTQDNAQQLESLERLRRENTELLQRVSSHHHHHFWQAPLRVRSAERRHQSPEWTVLSQVNCVVHIEVAGFQIQLNGFHPCNMRTSQWSPPVSCGGSC